VEAVSRIGMGWTLNCTYLPGLVLKQKIVTRARDIERQLIREEMQTKSSLELLCFLKRDFQPAKYLSFLNNRDRAVIAYLSLGIWKIKGCRGSTEIGPCQFCGDTQSVEHLLFLSTDSSFP
jgi:hypothetical protein